MKNIHISESALQEFIVNNTGSPEIKFHLQECDHCQAKLNIYRSMFKGVENLPSSEFDFDLSQVVVNRIEKSKSRSSIPIAILILLTGFFLVAIMAYVFTEGTISFVMSLQKMALYLVLVTGLILLTFQAIDMYLGYQKRMKTLNFMN